MTSDEPDLKEVLRQYLMPSRPVNSIELLKGRDEKLREVVTSMQTYSGISLIFGNRGVGKTSLAKTAAIQYASAAQDPLYVACGPGATVMVLLREVAIKLSRLVPAKKGVKIEGELSLSPALRFSYGEAQGHAPVFDDINGAIRVLQDFETLLLDPAKLVVILDELESLSKEEHAHLAFFAKQVGDQELKVRYIFCGIAENVHQLIGAHQSVPRYIRSVELGPLKPQDLIDIVSVAAAKLDVSVPRDMLIRIAIIGSGYPHFAHLVGLELFVAWIEQDGGEITADTFARAINKAVAGSIEELRDCYNTATQRGTDDYKCVVWTMADLDTVDVRNDELEAHYRQLARTKGRGRWPDADATKVAAALRNAEYGAILTLTPKKYGSEERRYRFQRFTQPLMRGYVRLRAEEEGVHLGAVPPTLK